MENKLIAKGTTTDINFFTLTINDKPIIVITENEFKYKGELIEDGGEIYKLFKNYLESYQKEVHKQEIKKVWFDSTMQFDNSSKMTNYKSFEDYYQETYGSKGSNETNGNNVEKVPNVTSSQTEISDEEITKLANEHILYNDSKRQWVIEGMKLYREQLKQRQ